MFVYTMHPVVKPVVIRYDNRFDNRVERTDVRSTGYQTGLYNRFDNGFDTTGCIVYTNIYPVVKPCLSNRFDNRLYCVNGALERLM